MTTDFFSSSPSARKPVVIGDACTRGHDSGCTACIEACPLQALSIDGDHDPPTVDPQACIACGICVPVCPTATLTGAGPKARTVVQEAEAAGDTLTIRCGQVAGSASAGQPGSASRAAGAPEPGPSQLTIRCLAALDPETLAAAAVRLNHGGLLELQHADCERCPLASGAQMRALTGRGAALAARIAPGQRVERHQVGVPAQAEEESAEPRTRGRRRRRRRRKAGPDATSAQVTRRTLLFGAWTTGTDRQTTEATTTDFPAEALPPGPAAPTPARGALLAVVAGPPLPRPIGTEGCTACGACTAVCPTRALGWTQHGPELILSVDPDACIACGECVRVCPEDVLGLATAPVTGHTEQPALPAEVTRVAIAGCDRCGNALSSGEQSLCQRCSSRRGMLDDVWAQLDG